MKIQSTIILFFILTIFSCQTPIHKKEYKLTLLDSYDFRRNYFGIEELTGKSLDSFTNRNPEQCHKCQEGQQEKLYDDLVKSKIIQNKTLNLSQFDTLPNSFIYNFSKSTKFNAKINNLEYAEGIIETPSFSLTFKNKERIVLKDTLIFDFPPDVIFSIFDLNDDGKDELCTLFRNYIINGDNYYLDIYALE